MSRKRIKNLTVPGRKIRNMREWLGLTRVDVAHGIGTGQCSEAQVKRWEDTHMPDEFLRLYLVFLNQKIEERRILVTEAERVESAILALKLPAFASITVP